MARDRSIKLVIQAQVDGAKRALNETAEAARKVGSEADKSSKQATTASERMVRSARDNSQAWNTAGTTLTAFGAASALALGGSAKAAIDWESAWAGVTKTVDGSATQMGALEGELREMARTLPATHTEIAAVAEAAGQLGIKREDITSFTRVMIDLGESTDLSADQAATGIAQIANVMGTTGAEIDNFGSTLVALGNAGASTESEILQLTQRLAGAGNLIGASEADVLALANAMASVGIEAQLGGGSMSRAMIQMNSAVKSGGDELTAFADVAGMTASQFAEQWNADPVTAVQAFITGLGGIQASGGDAAAALSNVGLKGTENAQVFLRLTGASDMLNDSLDLSKTAWEENTALSDEAGRRYETVASRLAVARNSAVDAAISLGEVFAPAIGAAADGAAGFAGWLADLPGPMQALAAGAGSAAAGVGLLGGGFLILGPRVVEAYDAFVELAGISPRLNDALGKMGRVVGAGGALVGGLAVLGGTLGTIQRATQETMPGVEGMTAALLDLAEARGIEALNAQLSDLNIQVNGLSGMAAGPIDDFGAALDRVLDPSFIERAEGLDKAISLGQVQTSGDRVLEYFAGLDASLSGLVQSGNAEVAADAFDEMWAAAAARGVDRAEFEGLFAGYMDSLVGVSNEARVAAPALDEMTVEMEESAAAAEAAQAALDEMRETYSQWISEIGASSASFATIEGALSAHQAATQEWAQGQADATETADDSWEDFYDGQSVNLAEYLAEQESMIEAQANWQENLSSLIGKVSDDTLNYLARLGPEGAPLVAALVDGTADELARFDENFAASGQGAGEAWTEGLRGQQALYNAAANELGTEAAAEILAAVQAGEMTVADAVLAYDLQAEMEVLADTDLAAADVLSLIADTEAMTAIANVAADTSLAVGQAEAWYFDTNSMRPVPLVSADARNARTESSSWADWTRRLNPVPRISADASNARGTASSWQQWASGLNASPSVSARTGNAYSDVRGLLSWVGRQATSISVSARYTGGLNVGGAARNMASARAAGGVERRPAMAGPGYGKQNLILWGEPETRGEAFISNHPSYKAENLSYLATAASWFDKKLVDSYATGGMPGRQYAMAPAASYAQSAPDMSGITSQLAALSDAVASMADRPINATLTVGERVFGAVSAQADQNRRRGGGL